MGNFHRYALYVMAQGALHQAASAWLGWDAAAGAVRAHPSLAGLPDTAENLTATPRKYGFHGTMKPPFALAAGASQAELEAACGSILPTLAAAEIDVLEVRPLSGFVAMVPQAPSQSLAVLAEQVVERFDGFRAPPGEGELARRRKAGLSANQEKHLALWGYPYVMDEFRFHMTLTGRLEPDEAELTAQILSAHFASVTPTPFTVDSLGLLGEDAEGRFHLIRRYGLAG